MIFLLDVNALIAFGLMGHIFHQQVAAWANSSEMPVLALCPITELGFVRILCQARGYGLSVAQSQDLLRQLKRERGSRLRFIDDDAGALHLPSWVGTALQVTDGHLVQLASAHGAQLATLDQRIPGAYLIPEL